MPAGAFRCVLRVGRFAVKLPRLKALAKGMRCNRWEREMWRTWRPAFSWRGLCPVHFADPAGLLVVMPWAQQPVTFEELVAAMATDQWPDLNIEYKPENFGRLGDSLVCLDYGLPDSDDVDHRRSYLKTHPARHR